MASDAVQELRQHAINGWVAYGARQMDRETALRLLVEYEDALIAAVREDEREKCETEMRRLRDEVARASWAGQIDRASGAFDPRERHEMGG